MPDLPGDRPKDGRARPVDPPAKPRDLTCFVQRLAKLAVDAEGIETALQRAADLAREHWDLLATTLWLVDPNGGRNSLDLRALSTRTPMASPVSWSLRASRGPAGRALRNGQAQLLVDVRAHADYVALFAETVAELVLPLRHRDGNLGVAIFDSDDPEAFSPETVALLEAVASQLAGLARFAALERRNQEMAFELEESNRRLREKNASLSEFATTDALTGLPNRRHFDQTLEVEWRRATRGETPIAIILADIDFFKRLNDSAGHQRGDVVLAEVAQVFRGVFSRAGDLAARYGGEEFVVVLPDAPIETAAELAEEARRLVEASAIEHPASELAPVVTLSMGVASVVPGSRRDPASLLAAADAALYQAKAKGRNRVERAETQPLPVTARLVQRRIPPLSERFPEGLPPGSKFLGFKSQIEEPED